MTGEAHLREVSAFLDATEEMVLKDLTDPMVAELGTARFWSAVRNIRDLLDLKQRVRVPASKV